MRKAIITIGLAAVLLSFAGTAQAEWVTIHIEAIVDNVDDGANYLGGKVNIGDTITGSYTYDTSMPDSNPSALEGVYYYNSPPAGMVINVWDLQFETDPTNVSFGIFIKNDYYNGDSYSVYGRNNICSSKDIPIMYIKWELNDPSGNLFSSDALTSVPPDFEQCQYNQLTLVGRGEAAYWYIYAHVTTAVPEPSTLALFAFGILKFVFSKNL